MRKILMLLLTAAMCLTACGKDAPLPEVPVTRKSSCHGSTLFMESVWQVISPVRR